MDPISIVREDMDRLRGRLFEVVEAVGFPDGQQDAVKRLIRRTTYDAQARVEAALRSEGRDARHPAS
jgi:hypothetical protein